VNWHGKRKVRNPTDEEQKTEDSEEWESVDD